MHINTGLKDKGPERGAPGAPKLLCVMLGEEKEHSTTMQIALRAWGWRCDGFMAASTVDDDSIGAVKMPIQGMCVCVICVSVCIHVCIYAV